MFLELRTLGKVSSHSVNIFFVPEFETHYISHFFSITSKYKCKYLFAVVNEFDVAHGILEETGIADKSPSR